MDNAKAERLGIASLPLSESIVYHARYSLGREWDNLHKGDLFTAVVLAIRERIVDRMLATEARYQAADAKRLYYLSMEFSWGSRSVITCITFISWTNADRPYAPRGRLGRVDGERAGCGSRQWRSGRLAACFGLVGDTWNAWIRLWINYEYGLFTQEINEGHQREKPDNWRGVWYPMGDRTSARGLYGTGLWLD